MYIIKPKTIIDYLVCKEGSVEHQECLLLFDKIESKQLNVFLDILVFVETVDYLLRAIGMSKEDICHFFTVFINLKSVKTDVEKSVLLRAINMYSNSNDNTRIQDYYIFALTKKRKYKQL